VYDKMRQLFNKVKPPKKYFAGWGQYFDDISEVFIKPQNDESGEEDYFEQTYDHIFAVEIDITNDAYAKYTEEDIVVISDSDDEAPANTIITPLKKDDFRVRSAIFAKPKPAGLEISLIARDPTIPNVKGADAINYFLKVFFYEPIEDELDSGEAVVNLARKQSTHLLQRAKGAEIPTFRAPKFVSLEAIEEVAFYYEQFGFQYRKICTNRGGKSPKLVRLSQDFQRTIKNVQKGKSPRKKNIVTREKLAFIEYLRKKGLVTDYQKMVELEDKIEEIKEKLRDAVGENKKKLQRNLLLNEKELANVKVNQLIPMKLCNLKYKSRNIRSFVYNPEVKL
jgi:hypothetical protein